MRKFKKVVYITISIILIVAIYINIGFDNSFERVYSGEGDNWNIQITYKGLYNKKLLGNLVLKSSNELIKEINLSYKVEESSISSITELIVESPIDNWYGHSTDTGLSQADLKFSIKSYDAEFSSFCGFENYNITIRWLESTQHEEVINVTKSK